MVEVISLVIGIAIGAWVGLIIGRAKGNEKAGMLWGAFLGPLGWIIAALTIKDTRNPCPKCKGPMPQGATKCMHCGSDVKPQSGYYREWKDGKPVKK